ncbi:MAG: serine/threonine-protein kinase [Cyanobacteria bacterium J06621_11]
MSASGVKPVIAFKTDLLSDYRLLALVGQGEFAQVYCAVHRRSGRLVAIKQTRHLRESTSQEALVMQRLSHPNVVGCHAISKVAETGAAKTGVAKTGAAKTGYQLVLDYCEGGTLRSHLNSSLNTATPLSALEIKPLIEDILKGLSHIHQRGIIHGDLKPENIFLTYPNASRPSSDLTSLTALTAPMASAAPIIPMAKIGDFGSARFTRKYQGLANHSKREIGSPTYAAPERFDGHSSMASDLYSIGVILYELIIGDRPFSGPPDVLKHAHQTKAVPFPSNLAPAAQRLLAIALHKQPSKRFFSADDMLMAVEQLFASTDSLITLPATPIQLSHTSLSQKAIALPSQGITAPVESLLTIPQGCCLMTDRSLHLITHKRELLSIARFRRPCWIAVSPDGKWFVAFEKSQKDVRKNIRRDIKKHAKKDAPKDAKKPSKLVGMLGSFSSRSGHQWRRSISLQGPLLTSLCANVLQIIAIDARYLLRVSTTQSRTYLECFTRNGRFVGEMALNISLTQVVPTAVPYQLIGLSRASHQAKPVPVLISLKPLQVQPIRLSARPQRVSALPWGYFISHQRAALFLDQSAQPLSELTEVPKCAAIAAINPSTVLIASNKASHPKAPASTTTAGASLLVADAKQLNLDIIF